MKKIHITANTRLSQLLKKQLINFKRGVGETPQVMTLAQWWGQWQTASLLQGDLSVSILPKRILSGFETQKIWEKLLDKAFDYSLLNPSNTAKQLDQAWNLLQEYRSLEQLEQCFLTEEVQLFIKLQSAYQQILKQDNLADKSGLQKIYLEQLKLGCGSLPDEFILHGFDDLPPFMQYWQSIVEARGCLVSEAETFNNSSKQQYFAASNLQDEAQQVSLWVMAQLELLQSQKPLTEIRIGIVAPNLNEVQFAVKWAVEEQLCQLGHQALSQEQGWLNVSLGKPLTELPIVQNALLTLELFANPAKSVRYDDWSSWLLSPYTQDSFALRHALDVQLRKRQWASFKWSNLLDSDDKLFLPKEMQSCLQQQAKNNLKPSHTLTEFVSESVGLLARFHWAKSQAASGLNSIEFQQKKTFLVQLTDFKSFHLMPKKQDFHAWLSLFKQYLSQQVHQPQSGVVQPIQLLGMLEASGQNFDALWVMGLNDQAWPRMPGPNPFLPLELQAGELQTGKLKTGNLQTELPINLPHNNMAMPRCDAQRELEYATTLMTRFSYSAKEVVWSYAKQKADQTLMPSPLLNRQLPKLNPQTYQSLASLSWQVKLPLEWQEDHLAPAIALHTKAPGGTGILAAQNICPLMAFMDYRLGTKYTIEPVEEGLQSTSLGNLIHQVLEEFWSEVKSLSGLLAKTEIDLTEQLTSLIATAMQPLKLRFDEFYLSLEAQRILELLLNWMALEKQRHAFTVINTELEEIIEVGGIQFKIKIDRIDQVGSELIILDYKTGKANIADLYSEKMSAPQLAIYLYGVESLSHKVAGLGYAILHSDDGVKLNVIVDDNERLHEKKPKGLSYVVFDDLAEKDNFEYKGWQWQDFLSQLKKEVEAIAIAVQKGEAAMLYADEKDLAYAGCKLALRLPEVKGQIKQQQLNTQIPKTS